MERIKKSAIYIAGVAFLLYAVMSMGDILAQINIMREASSFQQMFALLTGVIKWVAFAALGVACLIKKAEPVRGIVLLVPAAMLAVPLLMSVLSALMVLLGGEGIGMVLFNIFSLLSGLLQVFGLVILAIMVLVAWKKKESHISACWYIPMIFQLLSAFLSAFATFLLYAAAGGSLSMVINGIVIASMIAKGVVLAIGMGALGLSCVSEKQTVKVPEEG